MKNIKNSFSKFSLLSLTLLTTLFLVTGCEKDGLEGEVEVEMTDAPADYARVEVEITKVEIENESNEWITIEDQSRSYVVSDLTNGTTVSIANQANIEAGTYSRVRLTFGTNSKIKANNAVGLINFDAVASTSVVVPVNVEVQAEAKTRILLDFDIAQSVEGDLLTGFTLDPAMTMISNEGTGAQGTVEANAKAYVLFTNKATFRTRSTYTNASGQFKVIGLESGEYQVDVYPRSDLGYAEVTTVSNVSVQEGSIRQMGTITLD